VSGLFGASFRTRGEDLAMRVAVTGTNGQVGSVLSKLLQTQGHEVKALAKPNGDITDRKAVMNFAESFRPEIIFHPAAYTHVDNCESQPEIAYSVNALGTQNLALACAKTNATLLYISTNCVFDGSQPHPYEYWEYDQTNPNSVYGKSKLAGEWYVQNLLNKFYIVRTSWVFGNKPEIGKVNFVKRMLEIADEKGATAVVDDEYSKPTYAPDLAEAVCQLATTSAYGIYNLSNEGCASRFEYAAEIFRLSGRANIEQKRVKLADFKRPAPPLYNTPLKNFAAKSVGITLRSWQTALQDYLESENLIKK
jgi:dTDP-4-dehydrorhamnose reductase